MRVQAETPEPPAREPASAPEIAPVGRNGDLVGKERYTEKIKYLRCAPDSIRVAGFVPTNPAIKPNRAFVFSVALKNDTA
jgi:hypothetical protein